jgi:hypothetical protein
MEYFMKPFPIDTFLVETMVQNNHIDKNLQVYLAWYMILIIFNFPSTMCYVHPPIPRNIKTAVCKFMEIGKVKTILEYEKHKNRYHIQTYSWFLEIWNTRIFQYLVRCFAGKHTILERGNSKENFHEVEAQAKLLPKY